MVPASVAGPLTVARSSWTATANFEYGALVLLSAALIASGLLRALWSLRHRTGIGIGRAMLALLNWLSLSWTVAMAALQALVRSKAVFMRTPKERDHQTLWTAIRDARTETLLAALLWGSGIAIAVSGNAQPFLLVLFAWQGLVYASAPTMSWLNVRTVLTPELERRRRTELRRERAAALVPYYVGGTVAAAAVGLVAAVLVVGGTNPGTPPTLQLPHKSGPPGIIGPVEPRPTPSPGTTPAPSGEPPSGGATGEPTPEQPGSTTGSEPEPTSPAEPPPATTVGAAPTPGTG